MYAACGHSSNGSIRVIQADQTVDVLYESGADYPGIAAMWSLPPWPGAEFHSLLVLSFASGSRAMATGTCLHMGVLHNLVWELFGRGSVYQVAASWGLGWEGCWLWVGQGQRGRLVVTQSGSREGRGAKGKGFCDAIGVADQIRLLCHGVFWERERERGLFAVSWTKFLKAHPALCKNMWVTCRLARHCMVQACSRQAKPADNSLSLLALSWDVIPTSKQFV